MTIETLEGLPRSFKGALPESWHCIDCGFNTAPGFDTRIEMETAYLLGRDEVEQSITYDSEIYTVRDHVWKNAGMGPHEGCLCIGCLETRLGRRLRPNDFQRDHPFNARHLPATSRLKNRRSGKRESATALNAEPG